MTEDALEQGLEDRNALEEIELTSDLIIAASQRRGPLSPQEIDAILGVTPDTGRRPAR